MSTIVSLQDNPTEQQYLDLVRQTMESGDPRADRTGVGTKALFGKTMRFDLNDNRWPLLTTKKVAWKLVISELLWFLRGETNIQSLLRENNSIWTDWPYQKYCQAQQKQARQPQEQTDHPINQELGDLWTELWEGKTSSKLKNKLENKPLLKLNQKEFEQKILADDKFSQRWGELGPVYGKQWRKWKGADGQEYDQIAQVMNLLKHNPMSRRILFHAWNVAEIHQMALPPCHLLYQFFVSSQQELSLTMYQRSADLGLGVPFNIASGSLLVHLLAKHTRLKAKELIWMGGDTHVYLNHFEALETQLQRTPTAFPQITFDPKADLFAYQTSDFQVHNYHPQSAIKMDVAV